jgi:dephospho-CoA kinase
MLVIGITGPNCAGKDSAAHVLEGLGFERHSLSDVLREELSRRGQPVTREALIALGVELRRLEGPAVLADRVKHRIRTGRAALVSVRSPAEVASLRALPGFVLLGVTAPPATRFERERRRDREGAVRTLGEFLALEARERTTDANAQQLDAAWALVDEAIENDGTLEDLARKVADLVRRREGRAGLREETDA